MFTRESFLETLFILVTLPVVMRFAHSLLTTDRIYVDSTNDAVEKTDCEKKLPSSVIRKHIGPNVKSFRDAQKQCQRRTDTQVNHIFRTTAQNFVYNKNQKVWISAKPCPYYKLVKKEENWEVTEVGLMKAVFDEIHFNSKKSYETLGMPSKRNKAKTVYSRDLVDIDYHGPSGAFID